MSRRLATTCRINQPWAVLKIDMVYALFLCLPRVSKSPATRLESADTLEGFAMWCSWLLFLVVSHPFYQRLSQHLGTLTGGP